MPAATAFPGVYFAPPEPRVESGLPPLDVAAFVGFAERGPLHWPVALEDLATYREIFGGDLAVARDARGRALRAHLPRCVEAFFANGGRRCYVARVAGPSARRAEFSLPGLAALEAGRAARPTRLAAAWPGSWANTLGLACRLLAMPLPAKQFSVENSDTGIPALAWDSGGAPKALEAGDLLRVTLAGTRYLFPIAALVPDPANPSHWVLEGPGFRRLAETAEELPTTVAVSHAGGAEGWKGTLASEIPGGLGRLMLSLDTPDAATLRQGDILELRSLASPPESWLLPVEELRPAAADSAWRVLAEAALSPLPADPALTSPPRCDRVERLRFDLSIQLGGERRVLADLAFNAGHPRFFGDAVPRLSSRTGGRAQQPSPAEGEAAADARLYFKLQPDSGAEYPRIDPVRDGVPGTALLAGILAPLAAVPGVSFLPLGMAAEPEDFRAPDTPGEDGLERFDAAAASWFVEPDLVPDLAALASAGPEHTPAYPGTDSLLAEAFERVYGRDLRLRGMHGLLFVDEVALVCAPDAVHGYWPVPAGGAAEGSMPPANTDPRPPPAEGFRECSPPLRIASMAPGFGSMAGGTPVQFQGSGFVAGATLVRFGDIPATSVEATDPNSLRCLTPAAARAGTVAVAVEIPGETVAVATGFRYESEIAASLPLAVDPADFDLANSPLLAAQRELVRLCLARADAVAILGLPAHFEKRQCLAWLERLRPLLGWPGQGDSRDELGGAADLSYAAVYHPWPLQRDGSAPGGFAAIPPDGAVLGMIASSERRRMAWAAPANIPLREPIGLAPEFSARDTGDLLAACFNLVRSEPRGFLVASARTLNGERDLAQLSVRRFMILLRKTLAALGADLVFQGNSERLRGRLRYEVENLLRGFFDRGALAGRSYGEAFRVTVSGEGAEAGQLLAEIRVAPSRPVEFITVRLIRTGEGVLRIGEG